MIGWFEFTTIAAFTLIKHKPVNCRSIPVFISNSDMAEPENVNLDSRRRLH